MSFKYRFIVSFVFIEIIFILLIVSINFFTIDRFSKKSLDDKMSSTMILVKELLKSPISVYDLATIDNVVETTKEIDGLDSLIILDANDKLLSTNYHLDDKLKLDELLKSKGPKEYFIDDKIFRLSYAHISIDDTTLGNLYILFDITENIEAIESNKNRTFLLILLEIIVSTIFAYFIGMKLTTKLLNLKDIAQKIAKGKKVDIPFTNTKDEIGILANAMYSMNKEILAEKKKEKILQHQSKLATMGEMIGNIAHQWRQPLSAITSSASSIKLQKDLGLLDDETLDKFIQNIINSSNYLSNTINDFRDFFKKDKEPIRFKISEILDENIAMIKGIIKSAGIEISINIDDDVEIISLKNELLQAIINIINNARDALVSNQDKKRYIFIHTYIKDEHLYIDIKDNANGVPTNIIDKVFDPYFTTKHKSQGTGIGLYMTHSIITESLHGKIQVKNVKYEYDNTPQHGALFTITLPL